MKKHISHKDTKAQRTQKINFFKKNKRTFLSISGLEEIYALG